MFIYIPQSTFDLAFNTCKIDSTFNNTPSSIHFEQHSLKYSFFLFKMNTDSSDWKRFIPYSDELTRIYAELETCMNTPPSWTESEGTLPVLTNRSIDIFEDIDLRPKVSHVEQQLR